MKKKVFSALLALAMLTGCSGGNNGGGAGEGQVTISYDPGTGLLGDDEWEKVVDSGSRWYQRTY